MFALFSFHASISSKVLGFEKFFENYKFTVHCTDTIKDEEKKLLTEGEKAFQEFGKNINEAIKQNEAVVNEVEKDMDEGINYP